MALFSGYQSQKLLKRVVLPLTLLLLTAYFVYHLLEGRYGIRSWRQLEVKHKELLVQLDAQETKVKTLSDKVDRLRPNSLDLDFVEELVHDKLGVYHKDDIVVHTDA